jgi:hypothetical protein
MKRFASSRGGFSLAEIMVALGVGAFVSMSALSLMSQTVGVETRSQLQLDLDATHNVQVQKSRSIRWLRAKLPSLATNSCMGKSGTNCGSLSATDVGLDSLSIGSGLIDTTTTYSLSCAAERCDQLLVRVRTVAGAAAAAKSLKAKPRQTTFAVQPFLFVDRSSLNFNCVNSTAFSRQFDYYNLKVRCGTVDPILSDAVCGGNSPMRSYTGAVTCETGLTNVDCTSSNGVMSSSIFNASCSGPTTPPTLPGDDGQCGSANGGTFMCPPTVNLCNMGAASVLSGAGPWSWTCSGSNGGASDSCSAALGVSGCLAGCTPSCGGS